MCDGKVGIVGREGFGRVVAGRKGERGRRVEWGSIIHPKLRYLYYMTGVVFFPLYPARAIYMDGNEANADRGWSALEPSHP